MMNEVADWTLPCVRTLLNLAYSPGIAQAIRSAKMTGKLVPLTSSPDMRVSDAAKACLTELGYDMKRNIFDSRSMQERMSQNEQASIGFNVFLSHRRADSKVRQPRARKRRCCLIHTGPLTHPGIAPGGGSCWLGLRVLLSGFGCHLHQVIT